MGGSAKWDWPETSVIELGFSLTEYRSYQAYKGEDSDFPIQSLTTFLKQNDTKLNHTSV